MTGPNTTEALRRELAEAIAKAKGLNPFCEHEGEASDGTVDGYWQMSILYKDSGERSIPWHYGWRNHVKIADALIAGPIASLFSRIATLEAENERLLKELKECCENLAKYTSYKDFF